ncbi:TPA: serine acetyltransferase [Enterobacter hormaechei]|uniref:serine acetyltransferase n=1 Tax=Enterobacter cloacae complex TaxID=354276 RepID=UPI002074D1A2|nr:serine acetyltransferase [Enterobacter asburiae]MCM8137065.1 serine acetyltransferase [Enterobacter asburiae]
MISDIEKLNTSSNESLEHLKECLRIEVINRGGEKKFSWFKVFHRVLFSYKKRFYFWWRLASYLNSSPSKRNKKWARKINANLRCKYGVDISVEANIGAGLKLNHYVGIIIRSECIIGKNANIRQNTTIGRKSSDGIIGMTVIGDNVDIGAHSCIIGDVRIGDNVTIGAMTFVNKDVPANSIIYNPVTAVIKKK